MKKQLLLLFAVLFLSSFSAHKFYVSVTQIDYVSNKKRIEITHRIFIDDLEKALTKKYNKKVNLTSTKELPEAEELIKSYLKEKIKISINKKPQNIEFLAQGLRFDVAYEGSVQSLQLPLYGAYNIANVLGVVATLLSLGHSFADAVAACRTLTAVPGRMELLVQAASANVVVDYAHTPDALEQSLKALRPSAAARGGKIWCIFGCGGNRDSAKRPLMGAIAERYADAVVLTSDNPRDENPLDILAAIRAGFRQAPAHIEADRARAIRWALRHAAACDVILLAGKGHEDYQESDGVKRYFSDQAEVRKAWAEGVAA